MIKRINKKIIYLLALLVIALSSKVITGTYAKFTSGFETTNDIVGLNLSFNLHINSLEEYEEVVISANSYQIFNVDITNESKVDAYYGIWYMMVLPEEKTDDILIAKEEYSNIATTGKIEANDNLTTTIIIENNTSSTIKINIGVGSSETSTSDIEYLDGKKLITGTTAINLLSDAKEGSYVKYTGNNGCEGNLCQGDNANYVDKDNMGYCLNEENKFIVNGWRIAYVVNDTAYLVSAGATECIGYEENTDIDGTSNIDDTITKNLDILNNIALKYCNSAYAYGGICNKDSAWAFSDKDYKKIMDIDLSLDSCYKQDKNVTCGYSNNLINNGSFYWIGTNSLVKTFYWDSSNNYIDNSVLDVSYGVRPVLRLKASTRIIGGSGTYEDPYTITINR